MKYFVIILIVLCLTACATSYQDSDGNTRDTYTSDYKVISIIGLLLVIFLFKKSKKLLIITLFLLSIQCAGPMYNYRNNSPDDHANRVTVYDIADRVVYNSTNCIYSFDDGCLVVGWRTYCQLNGYSWYIQ